MEKPLAPDAALTETLLAAAADRGRLLVPVHQFLFQRGVQRLLSARGELGALVRCIVRGDNGRRLTERHGS